MKNRSEEALAQLRGIKLVIERMRRKTPTKDQIEAIDKMAIDAIAVLQEPDAVTQRLAFVVLAVKQSIQLKHPVIRGKRMTRVTIIDQTLFHWALEQIVADDFLPN